LLDHTLPPGAVDAVEGVGLNGGEDALDGMGREGDQVGITIHKADMAPVRDDGEDIAAEQGTLPACPGRPVEHRPAREMPTAADQGQTVPQGMGLALPVNNDGVGTHDPLAVGGVQVNRCIEGPAPLDHGRVIVRVGDGDSREASEGVHCFNRGRVDQADAIPEQVAGGRLD
jgi:hypothetical protein